MKPISVKWYRLSRLSGPFKLLPTSAAFLSNTLLQRPNDQPYFDIKRQEIDVETDQMMI